MAGTSFQLRWGGSTVLSLAGLFLLVSQTAVGLAQEDADGTQAKRPNIVFVLTDDHRYDVMGFLGHPFLETPHMDRLAREGVHFEKAMVTTSLCSPSRASILTGLYAHNHGVIDNYNPIDEDLTFFPEYLQQAGYETAFIGKWHMGDSDEKQPGFDHWIAFRGQGVYYADGHGTSREVPQADNTGYNINGEQVSQTKYITDELTDFSIDWLKGRSSERPFFLYLSHKGVHSDFVPADRHRGRYSNVHHRLPDRGPYEGNPKWVFDQENSRHGEGFAYNLADFDLNAYYVRYCEAVCGVDENLGRLIEHLESAGQLDNTLLVYMGDNGFQFGDHGLIDKRTAYEASIRVPLLMRYPQAIPAGTTVRETVANIDIAPTLLEAVGITNVGEFDGQSFWTLAKGEPLSEPWRDAVLYEYFWEWNYPQTPTMHAVVGDRWKFIRYHGIWDTDELYDLENDPQESRNLIADPAQQERVAEMKRRVFELLNDSGGSSLPLQLDRGRAFPWRKPNGPKQGVFPKRFDVPSEPKDFPAWARGTDTEE